MVSPLSASIERIGLLGCGRMGAAIGRHLLAAGLPLAVFDPVPAAARSLGDLGADVCADAGSVAVRSDLVLVVVVDDAQVREAVLECLDVSKAGTVLAICASVRPDTCRELAEEAARDGFDVIDAALVRGERGAEEGRLALFCGGPVGVVDRCRPAFAAFATDVVHIGDVGAGQVAKTANNVLLWACIRADVEAQRLARALGVEPHRLRAALAVGSGANRPLEEWGKHRLRWPQKDLEVAAAIAREAGVETPLVDRLAPLMAELTPSDLEDLL
jgi:3-hydroxyisobutyrate dehydrogenase